MRHALLAATILVAAIAPGAENPECPTAPGAPAMSHAAPPRHHLEAAPRLVDERITVTLDSAASAAAATPRIAPLLGDATMAVSGRWDDNNDTNAEALRRMKARGVLPTFYLNSNEIWHLRGEDYTQTARSFVQDGASIGGHALTHPYISGTARNRAFLEVMALRIEWETRLDSPVLSHAFSFVNYRNAMEGDAVHRDILHVLDRAGYQHLAIFKHSFDQLPTDLAVTPILPPENQNLEDYERAVQWLSTNDVIRAGHASFSNSMHSWYGTPALQCGWDELDRRLDIIAGREDFWYANHNAIGSYRAQWRASEITGVERDGATLSFTLRRPAIADANDDVPLTIVLDGVDASAMRGASPAGARVIDAMSGAAAINVARVDDEALPLRVFHHPSAAAQSLAGPKPPQERHASIEAALETREGALRLVIRNNSVLPLRDAEVRWRVPLAWQTPSRVAPFTLAPGEERVLEAPLAPRVDDPLYTAGEAYFVGQLDGVLGDERVRVYSTDLARAPFPEFFPGDRFTVLGPIERPDIDWPAIEAALSVPGPLPRAWEAPTGAVHTWRDAPQDGIIEPNVLSPEIVRTNGDWYKLWCPAWVLAATVESDVDQPARLMHYADDTPFVLLNGERADPDALTLRAGGNLLVLPHFFDAGPGDPRHVGCFIRLVDPATGERLENIRYRFAPVESGQ